MQVINNMFDYRITKFFSLMKANSNFVHLNDKVTYPTPNKEGSSAIVSMMKRLKSEKKLFIGINSTNQAILKDKTQIVVFASKTNPPTLTDHILFLCSHKKIPVITSNFSAVELGKELGIKSVGVAAISKSTDKSIIDLLMPYTEIVDSSNIPLYDF